MYKLDVVHYDTLCVQVYILSLEARICFTLPNPIVLDPGKGVCADRVNRGAILEGGGPGPPGGNKECQLSPGKGRGKT